MRAPMNPFWKLCFLPFGGVFFIAGARWLCLHLDSCFFWMGGWVGGGWGGVVSGTFPFKKLREHSHEAVIRPGESLWQVQQQTTARLWCRVFKARHHSANWFFYLSTVTSCFFKPTDISLFLHYKKGYLRCLLPPVAMETKQNGHQTTCK